MSRDLQLRGFKLTVSTKSPVTETDDKILVKYFEKNFDMYHVVAEHGSSGKRHLHALLCSEEPRVKRNLADAVWKKIKDRHGDSKQGIAVRVDVLYDNRWITEYLNKEATVEQIGSNYDPDRESDFYPSDELQDALQAIAASSDASDPYYSDLASKFSTYWGQRPGAPLRGDCIKFLQHRMFVMKDMRVIRDPRVINQIGVALWRYITADDSLDFEQRKYCASLEGPVMNFDDTSYVSQAPVGNPVGCRELHCERVYK